MSKAILLPQDGFISGGRASPGFQLNNYYSHAGWVPLQARGATSASTLAYSNTTTTNSLLVCGILSTSSVSGVSDNVNGSWTEVLQSTSTGGVYTSMWYYKNNAGGAVTVTATGSSGNGIVIGEASGAGGLDQASDSGSGTAKVFTLGATAALAAGGEPVFSVTWAQNATLSVGTAGATMWALAGSTFGLCYLTASSTAGQTIIWNSTTNSVYEGVVAAFLL